MATNKLYINFKILDYWLEDSIDRGYKPIKLFVLIEINQKLYLVEGEFVDEEDCFNNGCP